MSKFAKERQDNRMKDYKQSFNADEFKKRREESIISIRRQKREENILKRRNMDTPEEEGDAGNMHQLNLLPDFVQQIQTNDTNQQISGTIGIRRLLSIQINPPIDDVINSGVIPYLVQFLGREDDPKLQFEAAWALTNVASGTTQQTLAIISANAIPAFVNQLRSPEVSVREQAVWALGNIAGDSYQCRDQLLFNNVLEKLLPVTMENNIKPSLRRNAVWAISNLCRGKPAPPFSVVKIAIPYLAELIKSNDSQVVTDACWALSYLSDGDNTKIQAVINAGVCEKVVFNLMHQSQTVQTPSLRIIGNIVTGDDDQTQHVIDLHVLPRLKYMLDNVNIKKAIKKEVCWTISNITAGTVDQIQKVIDEDLFRFVLDQLNSGEYDTRKEAAWAIANATSSGSDVQVKYLVESGCIESMCELLTSPDSKIVLVCLEGLENILDRGENIKNLCADRRNPYAVKIEEIEGLDKIEDLGNSKDSTVYAKAAHFVRKFNKYVDSEDSMLPNPPVPEFQFGAHSMESEYSF